MKYYASVDGSVRPNPGQVGAIGFIIEKYTASNNGFQKELVDSQAMLVGNGSGPFLNNNNMEWLAISETIKYMRQVYKDVSSIQIFTDSNIVNLIVNGVKPLTKRYQSYEYAREVMDLISRSKYPIGIKWVKRSKNDEVDAMIGNLIDKELDKDKYEMGVPR